MRDARFRPDLRYCSIFFLLFFFGFADLNLLARVALPARICAVRFYFFLFFFGFTDLNMLARVALPAADLRCFFFLVEEFLG